MSKVRVHELAKQLGMESKEVLAKLQEMGEFVRSASSTVEAPVVRKLIALYPDAKPVEEKKPVKKAAAKKSAAKKSAEGDPALAAELAAELGVDLDALKASRAAAEAAAAVQPTATAVPLRDSTATKAAPPWSWDPCSDSSSTPSATITNARCRSFNPGSLHRQATSRCDRAAAPDCLRAGGGGRAARSTDTSSR